MAVTISEYARRPKRAREADGLNDVVTGITFLAITCMWYANQQFSATIRGANFQETSAFKQGLVFFILAIFGMFAAILLTKRVAATLRERFVYPRLGYVAQPTTPVLRQKLILMAVSVGSTLLIAAIGRNLMAAGATPPVLNSGIHVALVGAIGGATYFYQFAKLGFVRHLFLGSVIVLVALVLSLAKMNDLLAIGYGTVVWGVSAIVAGAVTFARLVRLPIISEEDTE